MFILSKILLRNCCDKKRFAVYNLLLALAYLRKC